MAILAFFPGFLLMIIETYVLVANRALQNPLRCFVFWDIRILKLNSLKNRENGHNMHQNGHIWYFLAIFVAGTFVRYVSIIRSQAMHLFQPLKKKSWFCHPKLTQKLKIWAY